MTQNTTSATSNRLLLTSVTEYGKNGGALPPTSFTWQQGTNDWEGFSGIQDDLCPNEDYSDAHTDPMVIGDFNGDGRTDVGRVASPGVSFYQPTDSGWQVMPFLGSAPQKHVSESLFVIPAQAGIQEVTLDSGQKHPGMTACDDGDFIVQRSS